MVGVEREKWHFSINFIKRQNTEEPNENENGQDRGRENNLQLDLKLY